MFKLEILLIPPDSEIISTISYRFVELNNGKYWANRNNGKYDTNIMSKDV